MGVTRHNYEEMFLLYLDGELSGADRQSVELFLAQHPDLKEEFDLLAQFRLIPDNDVVFPDRQSLYRPGTVSTEQLLDYMDGELTASDKFHVEDNLSKNPALQAEMNLLERARLEPEFIPFPAKDSLYREETRRIPAWNRWRIAASILLLIAAGITFLIMNSNASKDTPEIARETIPVPARDVQKDSPLDMDLANNPENAQSATEEKPGISTREKIEAAAVNGAGNKDQMAKQDSPLTNELPVPQIEEIVSPVAKATNPPRHTIDPEYSLINSAVTSVAPQPSHIVQASMNGEDIASADEPEGGNKSKLRGLFRKVTRTLEKRASFDATDEDDRLLVAGLAIKLK
jgi:hypothetical protein